MAAGVLTSVFVPTFVRHLIAGEKGRGREAADALTSTAIVALTAVAVAVALLAPWLMRVLLVGVPADVKPDAIDVGTDLLRFFAPQVVLYGVGMIMTAALHAHRRFTMAAVAPIFNNIVVIAVYLTYAYLRGDSAPDVRTITSGQVWVLGLGTTLGVVAMTACLLPSLRSTGWRFRFRPDVRHPAVREGARLGAWALSYAGGYQASLIVVLLLANRIEGGFAAYQWAFTYFYLPHAIFGTAIFNVLFTAMSERVASDAAHEVTAQLRDGLRMLWFLLLPLSAGLLVLSEPLLDATLRYGQMTEEGAELVARVLAGFAIGLPAYSGVLVLTRAFYAFSDTKTPALINAAVLTVSVAIGILLFFNLPHGWEVTGLSLAHTASAAVGFVVSYRVLTGRIGAILDRPALTALARYLLASAVAAGAMWLTLRVMDGSGALISLVVGTLAGAGTYLLLASALRSAELERLRTLAGSIVGRGSR